MKTIIAGIAVGLCLALPQILSAQDQSTGQSAGQSSGQSQSDLGTQVKEGAGAAVSEATSAMHGMRHTTPTDINKASKIIGMDVRNQSDEKLGTIQELVIDFQSQRVGYAVLEKADEQGDTGKYLAVPLNVLTPSSNQRNLTLNADKSKISSAQGFAKNQYPAMPLSGQQLSFWRSISEAAGASPGQQQSQPGQQQPTTP